MIDIISPSKTGMGLEIVRTKNLVDILLKNKINVRVWTFHPYIFNETLAAIIPLQEGSDPVTPHYSEIINGAFWAPHLGEQGPYICNTAITMSRKNSLICLNDKNLKLDNTGSLPSYVNRRGRELVKKFQYIETGLIKTNEVADYIVVNLLSAHGSEKGLIDLDTANDAVKKLSKIFPNLDFICLINANTCRGSHLTSKMSSNVYYVIHFDNDARIKKIIFNSKLVISVEGGLIHYSRDLNKKFVMLTTHSWFNKISYLYEKKITESIYFIEDFSCDSLVDGISEILIPFDEGLN